jgi:hypothetical protein
MTVKIRINPRCDINDTRRICKYFLNPHYVIAAWIHQYDFAHDSFERIFLKQKKIMFMIIVSTRLTIVN